MTDLATRPDADESSIPDDTALRPSDPTDAPPPVYEWAPAPPPRRNRGIWLWIGVILAAVALGVVANSLVLIAPPDLGHHA